ncbi:MAG: hypothetical protein MUF34_34670 [Polyangiaceae bacterium]|jgi:hypothetical protein|nr:hypothetical protein [Polyangiaceae bacterium]
MSSKIPSLFDLSVRRLSQTALANLKVERDHLRKALLECRPIRVVVPATLNYGHQGNSVHFVRRLVELGATSIEIVYDDKEDALGVSNSVKLLKLMPEATAENVSGTGVARIHQARVNFVKLPLGGSLNALSDTELAVSGGHDLAKLVAPSHWKAESFLCLQPFAYEKKGLPAAQNVLTTASGSTVLDYVYKPFYCEDPGASKVSIETLDLELTNLGPKGAFLRRLLACAEGDTIELCPMYFSAGRTMSWYTWIYLGLLLGLRAHQRARKPPTGTVLLSFVSFATPTRTHAQELSTLEAFVKGNSNIWQQVQKFAKHYPNAANIFTTLKGGSGSPERFEDLEENVVFFNLDDIKDHHIDPMISELTSTEAAGKICVLSTERVPSPVFWRFFAAAHLPCIFEGEGSAAPLCNLGKPFLHLYSYEWAEKNQDALDLLYPDPELQPIRYGQSSHVELDEMRRFCSNVVWALTPERGYDTTGLKPSDLLPVEQRLAAFLNDVTTPGTYLRQYFHVLRAAFHNEGEDKVLQGLRQWLAQRKK